MAEKGNKRAKLAFRLSEDYDHLISSILIGNNIVNIALASIGTLVFVDIWGHSGATISTIVITIDLRRDHAQERSQGHSGTVCHVLCSLYQSVNDPFDTAYLPFRKVEAFSQQAF